MGLVVAREEDAEDRVGASSPEEEEKKLFLY